MRRSLLLAALAAPFAVAAAPAAKDWTAHVVATPAGAYVMGNPAAKAKLVEYISYTCDHCARFTGESAKPLKSGYVAKGATSVEFRHAVRDPVDFAAALLARCGGGKSFFRNSEAILAAQDGWFTAAAAYVKAQGGKPLGASNDEVLRALARESGLKALMGRFGYSAAQLDACLTDKQQQKLVAAMTAEAWERAKIPGTPSFAINGRRVEGPPTWAVLEPALRAALN